MYSLLVRTGRIWKWLDQQQAWGTFEDFESKTHVQVRHRAEVREIIFEVLETRGSSSISMLSAVFTAPAGIMALQKLQNFSHIWLRDNIIA